MISNVLRQDPHDDKRAISKELKIHSSEIAYS